MGITTGEANNSLYLCPFSPTCVENQNFQKFSENQNFHELKISASSLVLRTREITDIFNTFDEIYLVFTSKM